MKRNNLFLVFVFSFLFCKGQNYKVIQTSNDNSETLYYFHSNNEEFARTYINNSSKDSLSFSRIGNDLLMEEFSNNENKENRLNGSIKYVDYYSSISDIIVKGSPLSSNEVPITNFNFIKRELELEHFAKENCNHSKRGYIGCDFILPKEIALDYLPMNSKIISVDLIKNNNHLKELAITAEYMGDNFCYNRIFYYENKLLKKIITTVKDRHSKNKYEDKFEIIKIE